jgi:hypothetical protein
MNDARPKRFSDSTDIAVTVQQTVYQCLVGVAATGMYDQARRLVNDDKGWFFMQNAKLDLLGLG